MSTSLPAAPSGTGFSAPSAVSPRLKRSRSWSVSIVLRPAFCWLTTVDATSILNRCKLEKLPRVIKR
ncbi:hypothetical protein TMatcc_004127 [Talaromyces marneffei ATCC 18224]